eukprot:gene5634-biopygen656
MAATVPVVPFSGLNWFPRSSVSGFPVFRFLRSSFKTVPATLGLPSAPPRQAHRQAADGDGELVAGGDGGAHRVRGEVRELLGQALQRDVAQQRRLRLRSVARTGVPNLEMNKDKGCHATFRGDRREQVPEESFKIASTG